MHNPMCVAKAWTPELEELETNVDDVTIYCSFPGAIKHIPLISSAFRFLMFRFLIIWQR